MDLAALNKFQLYDHLIHINDAYIRALERDSGSSMDLDAIQAVKHQFHEVIAELGRRRAEMMAASVIRRINTGHTFVPGNFRPHAF